MNCLTISIIDLVGFLSDGVRIGQRVQIGEQVEPRGHIFLGGRGWLRKR